MAQCSATYLAKPKHNCAESMGEEKEHIETVNSLRALDNEARAMIDGNQVGDHILHIS